MKTGKLVEAIMQYRHIGVEELAEKIGIEPSNMYNLIIGRRNITTQLAAKIGKELDIEPSIIMANRVSEELKAMEE